MKKYLSVALALSAFWGVSAPVHADTLEGCFKTEEECLSHCKTRYGEGFMGWWSAHKDPLCEASPQTPEGCYCVWKPVK